MSMPQASPIVVPMTGTDGKLMSTFASQSQSATPTSDIAKSATDSKSSTPAPTPQSATASTTSSPAPTPAPSENGMY